MVDAYLSNPTVAGWQHDQAHDLKLLRMRFKSDRGPFDRLARQAREHDVHLGCSCPSRRNPDVRHCHTVPALTFMKHRYPDLKVVLPPYTTFRSPTSNQESQPMGDHADLANAALQAKLKQIQTELARWNRGNVLGRHRIGQLVHEMLKGPATYGQEVVPWLARQLGCSKTWLYDGQMVAEAWNQEQIGELMKERDAKRGQPITWSHLVPLASLTDGRQRRKWITRS